MLFNVGPGRRDFTCGDYDISVPHVSINATSRESQRFFGAGNERSNIIFSDWGVTDAGYKIKSTDSFASLIEVMNENVQDEIVWLTATYDIVDGHPYDDDIQMIWLDVRQCGSSQVNPPKCKSYLLKVKNVTKLEL